MADEGSITRQAGDDDESGVHRLRDIVTSNAIPVEGTSRRREIQEVSWPLDMNRPISRDRVDKAISFYD